MSNPISHPDFNQHETPSLERPIRYLPGVGEHRANLFENLGIVTVRDLLWYVPRDVLDLSKISTVNELTDDRVHTVRGTVIDVESRAISRGRTLTAALLRADDGLVKGVWFNQPWMLRKLNTDQWMLWSAKPKFRDNRWEMNSPRLQWLDADEEGARGEVLTKYGLTEGLKQDTVRNVVKTAMEFAIDEIVDDLPERFRAHYQLPLLGDAIKMLHQPESVQQFLDARRRLVFDEQLDFQLGLAIRRRVRKTTGRAPAITVSPKVDARIRRLFDFELTPGQEQAIAEIREDIQQNRPMHRLLQADVGAGKTVVAIYAMLASIAAGSQAILMAPTELLARQHWNTIDQILLHSRVKRCLLTGNLTASQRKETLQQIASGEIQLIIGTQAVIQKDVVYHQPGVVVIDEQHKFGVVQRARFTGKENEPHVLVMTATPIPRSLCLTQYGDLDLSVITDKPPGRRTVVTSRVMTPKVEQKAWHFIREKLQSGRQAYIVCPYIDSENPDDPAGAIQTFNRLSQTELRGFRLGLVHGQIERDEQQQVMSQFVDRQLDALVATTVLEVGVDVANATLMVILDAHQFGLSQLHQLRGRIGRGAFQGYCFLFSDTQNETSIERLAAMERTANGFEIAEADFELRGPGNVLGTRQSGSMPFRLTNFKRDEKILTETRLAAQRMVDAGTIDQPEFSALKNRVFKRFGEQLDLPRTG